MKGLCESCQKSSKNNETLCHHPHCKAWIHTTCLYLLPEVKSNASKEFYSYYCSKHEKVIEKKEEEVVQNNNNNEDSGEANEEFDNILEATAIELPQTDNASENKISPHEFLNNYKSRNNTGTKPKIMHNVDPGSISQGIHSCVRCKKEIFSHYVSCFLCESYFHINCLDALEVTRINNKEVDCAFCYKISSKYKARETKAFEPPLQNATKITNVLKSQDKTNHSQTLSNNSVPHINSNNNQSQMLFNPYSITHNPYNDFFQKYYAQELPEVTEDDSTWSIFYEAFKKSCNLFDDYENIVRIKKAIKSKEILSKGGPALTNPLTYKEAIESLHKRIGRNLNFIHKEAKKLLSTTKIKSDNHKKIVEFIDELRSFVQLTHAYRDYSYNSNKIFINSLTDCLPSYILNKWIDKQCEVESFGQCVNLNHLMDVLERELLKVECRIRNNQIKLSEPDHKPKFDKPRVHTTEAISKQKEKVRFDNKYCWLHRNTDHPSHKCKALWSMEGKVVADLARQNNRCTTCGQAAHDPCPVKEKLLCKVEDCNIRHHALYCHRRKSNWKPKKIESYNHQELDNNSSIDDSDSEKEFLSSINLHSEEEFDDKEDCSAYYTNTDQHNYEFNNVSGFHNKTNTHTAISNNKTDKKEEKSESCPSIMGVLVVKLEEKVTAAFLIDSGSNVSLIEERLANYLKLKGPLYPLILGWSGDHMRQDKRSRIVKVKISNLDNKDNSQTLFFRTLHNLDMSDQKFVASEFYKKFSYLKKLNLHNYEKISGLIGIDNLIAFERLTVFKSPSDCYNFPVGVKSPLGDYVMFVKYPLRDTFYQLQGFKNTKDENSVCNNHSYELSSEEKLELEEMEKDILGMEYFQPKENDRMSYEEETALSVMKRHIKRLEDSRYEAPLLWRDENICLPTEDSYKIALRRYLIVEKYAKKLGRFEECEAQMKNLIDKNYARELSDLETSSVTNKSYYNPIFYIFPKGKRFRMIWDLASKTNNKSLNDHLFPGPNLYINILQILFQMCENTYMFKADMQEMFHQIRIREEDTEALRFLFKFENDPKIRVYKMLVLPFGASCSPSISQYVKNLVAQEIKIAFPIASDIISNSTYVDDIIKSFKDLENAQIVPLQIKDALKSAGFNLLKFNSNCKDLISYWKTQLSDELHNEKLFSEEKCEKTLGYMIDFSTNTISLSLTFAKVPTEILKGTVIPTKRQYLQLIMSIFDPIGFFQFVTSKLKLIYHRICNTKTNWEDKIPEEVIPDWKKLLPIIQNLEKIKIPRQYVPENISYAKAQLFCFADAGLEMLCCVIYVRFLDENNSQIAVRLLYAKSFTVPSKQNRTIPELELDSSNKLCKMVKEVKEKHSIKFDDEFYFTDNSPDYEWITRGPKNPSIYVNNRIKQILNLTSQSSWRWIPTEYMPADYGTKMSSMPELKYDNFWFMPKLFRLPESSWPSFIPNPQENITEVIEETICNIHNNTVSEILPKLHPINFKYYNSIIYAGQFCFKIKLNFEIKQLQKKIREIEKNKLIDPKNRQLRIDLRHLNSELDEKTKKFCQTDYMFDFVEKFIIKQTQKEAFAEEIDKLKTRKVINTTHKLSSLLLWLDEDGIIRVKTRITPNSDNIKLFGYDRIFPILLPKNHRLTELLIMKEHKNKRHIFRNNIIVALRSRYFIPNIVSVVKKVTKDCQFCIRYNAVPITPLMGNLPNDRIKSHIPPFTYVMIDIAGFFTVKITRNISAKRYILVVTCLNTRAIHMEVVENLDTNSTLIALQNTFTIRGQPLKIYSDNGTNFHGANNLLLSCHKEWNIKLLERGHIRKPIEWIFGPARSPHTQGAVERLIGITKKVMSKILTITHERHENLNDFSFRAIIYEVISIINNRPLCLDFSTNTDILTPNHFLLMRANNQETPRNKDEKMPLKDNWIAIKNLSTLLWNFWVSEYLPKILYREKWIIKAEPFKVGDLVITYDSNVTNSWRLGKIIKVHTGSLQQTRKLDILLGKKNFLDKNDIVSKTKITKAYQKEKQITVSRHANSVAKIRLDAKF